MDSYRFLLLCYVKVTYFKCYHMTAKLNLDSPERDKKSHLNAFAFAFAYLNHSQVVKC